MNKVDQTFQRGNLVVFYTPTTHLPTDPMSTFLRFTGLSAGLYEREDNIEIAHVKRLIGLPGGAVTIESQRVLLNNQLLQEPYLAESTFFSDVKGVGRIFGSYSIPADHYFVLGDHRNRTLDSRFYGPVKKDRLIGKATYRLWPPHRYGQIEGNRITGN